MSTLEIKQPIKSVSLKQTVEQGQKPVEPVPVPVIQDIDPITLHIPRRPEGALDGVNEKIVYYAGSEGKKTIYISVSFMPVTGVIDGKEVTIERPIEFFVPHGQLGSEQQWVVGLMRVLSLAARGGNTARSLQDLRKVTWDRGLVSCGKHANNKPVRHESVVAALAWAFQQILIRRGFLNEDGTQASVEELVAAYDRRMGGQQFQEGVVVDKSPYGNAVVIASKPETTSRSHGVCPECESDNVVLMDGCPTCRDCGHSKCG